jgi:glucose-1-phosphate cytidylyltransferase
MKVVILCGGFGSRLSEETKLIPKPMVKIGRIPILSHIINIYKKHGLNDIILATGYKSQKIKKYYSNKKNIRCVFTGLKTLTGGRILRLKRYFKSNEDFMLTYGDGLSSQNIRRLYKFHSLHKKIATLTAVKPPVRFGEIFLKENKVASFREKPQLSSNNNWINGGFFVFNSKIFNYISDDNMMLEREPFQRLTQEGQLMAYKHAGFWQCMDTLRDKILLNKIYKSKKIPWL